MNNNQRNIKIVNFEENVISFNLQSFSTPVEIEYSLFRSSSLWREVSIIIIFSDFKWWNCDVDNFMGMFSIYKYRYIVNYHENSNQSIQINPCLFKVSLIHFVYVRTLYSFSVIFIDSNKIFTSNKIKSTLSLKPLSKQQ